MRRATISDDEGNTYDMASSLATYLMNRKTVTFNFGDWLHSLTDAEILRLQQLDCAADIPGNTALAHILNIALLGVAGEVLTPTITLDEETISYVGIFTSFEVLKRKGFLELDSPLRLSQPEQTMLRLTEEGMQAGVEMYASISKH